MALSSTHNPLLHTTDEWNAYKHLIEQHYMQENQPLTDVMKIMKDDYGFEASVKAYKLRFKTWKWEKNVTRPRLAEALRNNAVVHTAGQAGPAKTNRLTGDSSGVDHVLARARIDKYLKKNKIDIRRLAHTQALWHRMCPDGRSTGSFSISPRLFVPAHLRAFESVACYTKRHMQHCISLMNAPKDELLRPHSKTFSMHREVLVNSFYVVNSSLLRGEVETALLFCKQALHSVFVLIDDWDIETILAILAFIEGLWHHSHNELTRALCCTISRLARRRLKPTNSLYRALTVLSRIDLSELKYLRMQLEEIYFEVVQDYLYLHSVRMWQHCVAPLLFKLNRDMVDASQVLKMVSEYDDAYDPANWASLRMLVELGHNYHRRDQLEEARSYFTAVIERINASNYLDVANLNMLLECETSLAFEKVCTPADHDDGILMMEQILAELEYLTECCSDQCHTKSRLQIIDWLIADASNTGDIDRVEELYDRKIEIICQNASGDAVDCDVSGLRDALEGIYIGENTDHTTQAPE